MSQYYAKQETLATARTSSKTGTFYFAYGSNLSPSQMRLRLNGSPHSSKPLAVAKLESYDWIICGRGYANVVATPVTMTSQNPATENVTWGLIYNLDLKDEARLDQYEGHNQARNPEPEINSDPQKRDSVPYLQGQWDYNKHYLPVTVTRWLDSPERYGVVSNQPQRQPFNIRALVYVDEYRTEPGKINQEYIGRMNRAIDESVRLGIPSAWIDLVVRKFVPAGPKVHHHDYVGTDQGYLENESTESASELEKRMKKELAVHPSSD